MQRLVRRTKTSSVARSYGARRPICDPAARGRERDGEGGAERTYHEAHRRRRHVGRERVVCVSSIVLGCFGAMNSEKRKKGKYSGVGFQVSRRAADHGHFSDSSSDANRANCLCRPQMAACLERAAGCVCPSFRPWPRGPPLPLFLRRSSSGELPEHLFITVSRAQNGTVQPQLITPLGKVKYLVLPCVQGEHIKCPLYLYLR